MPALEPDVDGHSHIWTPDTGHYPLAEGFRVEDMKPRSFTAEELLATCRPNGVGRVNLIQMSFYGFDNSYMLDMIHLYPDRFVGTAVVDPFGPDPGRAMLELKPRGVRAFRIKSVGPIGPNVAGRPNPPADRWLAHPGYDAMFAAADEEKLALSGLVDPDAIPEIDRMCRKHPGTTFIVDHLARIGASGTIEPKDVDALCSLAERPKVFVKVGAFYALGKKAPPYADLAGLVRRVVGAFGADRCFWESDCPYQLNAPHTYRDSLALVRDRLDFLTADQKAWLLRRTAARLLFGEA